MCHFFYDNYNNFQRSLCQHIIQWNNTFKHLNSSAADEHTQDNSMSTLSCQAEMDIDFKLRKSYNHT